MAAEISVMRRQQEQRLVQLSDSISNCEESCGFENLVTESSYDFSVVDSNALSFVFKNSPKATKEIEMNTGFPIRSMSESDQSRWLALFPVSLLFSGSLKCSAKGDEILRHYEDVPSITWYARNAASATTYSRKIFMELNLGSLNEVWVTVFNITGPLSNWSFADYTLPASEVMNGGPPSYICRLSGKSDRNWSFWLELDGCPEEGHPPSKLCHLRTSNLLR